MLAQTSQTNPLLAFDELPAPAAARLAPEILAQQQKNRRRQITTALGALALAVLSTAGYLAWDQSNHFESTDDAFIAARQFSLAPKVAGYLASVAVTDNQHVNTGDLIARIDDRDYRAALAQAQAEVASAQASADNITAQIAVQQAQIGQSQAQVQQQQASVTYDGQQSTRYGQLAHDGWGTVQNAQQWTSQLQQGQAGLKSAQQSAVATARQLESLKAQHDAALANLASAQAQLDQAKLNFSYTMITAAQPGRVVQLSAATGQYVQAGTSLAMFVPDDLWVTGNFKEIQLDHMRPGQPVTLKIDAYPSQPITGHVASVQPGSGTAFALLPTENATGNYVKVVQRVPVKITLDSPPATLALGPGMSVVPSVRINPNKSLLERLEDVL